MERDLLFKQAEEVYKSMAAEEKKALVYNIAESIMFIDEDIQEKLLKNLETVNAEFSFNIKQRL